MKHIYETRQYYMCQITIIQASDRVKFILSQCLHYSWILYFCLDSLLYMWLCVCACSIMTLCDSRACSPPSSSDPWNSPGKNTGVGCHSLFQGIFLTQGLNPGLLHCRQLLYHLSHQGSSYVWLLHWISIKFTTVFLFGLWKVILLNTDFLPSVFLLTFW